ncbi:septal ring lytic transglycosylase RlpA family protein [Halomonas sp. QX-2]|jgi:rare lipoprotein A|uniref:Endolytic peptidoglycan transglycosylase RlpA n=1 Tax=Vreelandella sedimenti TaxID=2729618 RepID=A0A7Z0N879_9GAMM|nr:MULTISPECIES: septal ring lytic transglycosylase RlpA family protein [Halomonas]NYT73272.1 septal ring lytic transglycosylase RlpA family protein [Halomonas sedimenti]|tara:strand:- start:8464 stop:8844 length:381 start_codon:yes stop_codon:yes gene_type:complete
MGAQKRLIRTICLAAVVASSAANSAFAHETEIQEGVASFYSDRFQGATTASGEPFDQQALTAAHPSLPFGTKVLVTRPDTGQEVEVLINDRGPFIQGRIIDLSKRAAAKLGMIRRGTAPVMVTLLD